MVRDLAQGSGSLPDEPDGPRVRKGGRVRRQRLDLTPGDGPHRGEVLGFVYGRQADLNTSNRRRAEEKQRIWD
jgi:hypothetical protein